MVCADRLIRFLLLPRSVTYCDPASGDGLAGLALDLYARLGESTGLEGEVYDRGESYPSIFNYRQLVSSCSDRVCYDDTDSLTSLLFYITITSYLPPPPQRYPATHHSAHTTSTTSPKKLLGSGRWKSLGVWYIM
jgi:hypothetical protein